MGNTTLEAVDRFTYLGSIQVSDSGTDADHKARLGKGLTVFKDSNRFGLHMISA